MIFFGGHHLPALGLSFPIACCPYDLPYLIFPHPLSSGAGSSKLQGLAGGSLSIPKMGWVLGRSCRTHRQPWLGAENRGHPISQRKKESETREVEDFAQGHTESLAKVELRPGVRVFPNPNPPSTSATPLNILSSWPIQRQ